MLKRKIEKRLTEWKNTPGHKPLIIKGCRQCGKTFSVLEFAKKNYKHVVYLNFFENPDYASVFAGSLDIDNIVMLLSALLGKEADFETGETVLVLDEAVGGYTSTLQPEENPLPNQNSGREDGFLPLELARRGFTAHTTPVGTVYEAG